jgi:hypothetical protein
LELQAVHVGLHRIQQLLLLLLLLLSWVDARNYTLPSHAMLQHAQELLVHLQVLGRVRWLSTDTRMWWQRWRWQCTGIPHAAAQRLSTAILMGQVIFCQATLPGTQPSLSC